MKYHNINQKGFSLIEIMAAMSILVMVLLPIVSVLSVNNRQNTANERVLIAKHLAQSKIEEIKAMNWYEFKTNYLDNITYQTDPNPMQFESQYNDGKYLADNDNNQANDFTYRISIWPSDNRLLYTVQVTVFYQEAGREKWQTLYTEKSRR